jgi:hypothetical protein
VLLKSDIDVQQTHLSCVFTIMLWTSASVLLSSIVIFNQGLLAEADGSATSFRSQVFKKFAQAEERTWNLLVCFPSPCRLKISLEA